MTCVNCGKQTSRLVCHECLRNVMEEADRERIPLVGGTKPEARRIGFDTTKRDAGPA